MRRAVTRGSSHCRKRRGAGPVPSRVTAVAVALAVTASGAITALAVMGPAEPRPAQVAAPVATAAPGPVKVSASRSRPVVAAPRVAPLKVLRTPDLLVTVRRPLAPAQLTALHAIRGMQGVTTVDVGTVRIGGKGVRIAGVDPSQFRQFTPRETATSDALWQTVARGELAPSYGVM